MKTIKEVKEEIKNLKERTPEGQVRPGLFIKLIGRKYVHVLNIHDNATMDKINIDDFYNTFISNDYRSNVCFK